MSQVSEAQVQNVKSIAPSSLPTKVNKFLEMRKSNSQRSLHDEVESLYLSLYEDETFRALRDAVYQEQSAEGRFIDDDVASAAMIRDAAKRKGIAVITREKLSVIRHSIGVVERRYNATRKQRRETAEKLAG